MGLNQRPPDYESDALTNWATRPLVENNGTAPLSIACKAIVLLFKLNPLIIWGTGGTWTHDLLINSQMLLPTELPSQLYRRVELNYRPGGYESPALTNWATSV